MPFNPSPVTAMRSLSRFTDPLLRRAPSRTIRASPAPFFHRLPPQKYFSTTHHARSLPGKPLTDRPTASPVSSLKPASMRPSQPEYQITFTCTPCSTRSAHRISKQGYHHGSVLITCPECKNKHVISDNLNVFGDKNMTIEDLMKEQGQLVKKGTLSENGDLELWEDGSVSHSGGSRGDEKGVLIRGKESQGEEKK